MAQHRVESRFAPSQWEPALLYNDVSHWLGARLESALLTCDFGICLAPVARSPLLIKRSNTSVWNLRVPVTVSMTCKVEWIPDGYHSSSWKTSDPNFKNGGATREANWQEHHQWSWRYIRPVCTGGKTPSMDMDLMSTRHVHLGPCLIVRRQCEAICKLWIFTLSGFRMTLGT